MARMRTTYVAEVAQLAPVGLPAPQAPWEREPSAPRRRFWAEWRLPAGLTLKRTARVPALWEHVCESPDPERRPVVLALLLSVALHSLMFSLIFGDQEHGLPGFALPWRDRRVEVPDLRIVLVPTPTPPAAPAPPPRETAVAIAPPAKPTPSAKPTAPAKSMAPTKATAPPKPTRSKETAAPANAPVRAQEPDRAS